MAENNKYDKNKKQYERAQQNIISFEILNKKCLQDWLILKNMILYVTFSQSTLMKLKMVLF